MGWWLPAALVLFAMLFTVVSIILTQDKRPQKKEE